MEQLKPIFTTYLFDVKVITPVHVGIAQEKNYVRGLDYVLQPNGQDATLMYLNQQALLKQLANRPDELTGYSAKLAAAQPVDIENFLRNKKLLTDETIRRKIKVQGQPDEIRRVYQTGMGQFTIPGSSLKGALRSIIYASLKSRLGQNATEQQLFGQITDNLMRYLQVSDVTMKDESVEIYGTKVFSGDGDPRKEDGYGAWKHKGGHREDFKEKGFSFFYEAIKPYSRSTLSLRLPTDIPHSLRDHAYNYTPNFDILHKKSGDWLLTLIRAHTDGYLKKETAYYAKFPNAHLDVLKPIKNRLQELMDGNRQTNSCLLRVGGGVGYHSITGDWQLKSQDHFSDWNQRDHAIANKTRKFAYTFSEDENDYVFYPMGFVMLTLR